MDSRAPQSQSAHAARSATRNRPRLRAVRDEAELSKHQESVPIPAKVLDLTIPCDADERGGHAPRLVRRPYRLRPLPGPRVRPSVHPLHHPSRALAPTPPPPPPPLPHPPAPRRPPAPPP